MKKKLKDSSGNYYLLAVNPESEGVSASEYVPEEKEFPNACRYLIYSYNKEEGYEEALLVHDLKRKEEMVIQLKRIHGLTDPWDSNPDYFMSTQ